MKGIYYDMTDTQLIDEALTLHCKAFGNPSNFLKSLYSQHKSNRLFTRDQKMRIHQIISESLRSLWLELKKNESKKSMKKHGFPGHWRRLSNSKQLGKDVQGNYNIPGKTWVMNYVRGK